MTSYENVKRLQKAGLLNSKRIGRTGRFHLFDRLEVEELARRRAKTKFNTPTGELTARVFRMFQEGKTFAEIVIATDQRGETILRLWEQYTFGFELARSARADDANPEDAMLEEHEQQIREMDRELERRRVLAHGNTKLSAGDDDVPPSHPGES